MNRPVRVSVVLLSLAALAGCTSTARPRAGSLASAGGAATRVAADSVREAAASVDRYVEAQLLLAPLTGRPDPAEETLATLRKVRSVLAARGDAMSELGAAYAGLDALAAFDAADQVERGVNDLAGAVSAYREALGRPAAAPVPAFGLSKGLGAFAGARHAARLKKASAAIRESLERFVALLRTEREVHASLRRALVEGQGTAARAFAALGLARPGTLLAPHAAAFGLAWDEKEYDGALALLRKEPSITGRPGANREDDLRAALDRVLEHRVARRVDLEGALVDETLAGLEALVLAHRSFEAKQETDLAAVHGHVAAVRALLDEYRAAAGK
ncbi:MAG TPA: hypothetical protein P5164_02770 [Thermoanaerobaculia bacterium]|nr:hypothetical protein [Thermoanaerobaculia bacterium]